MSDERIALNALPEIGARVPGVVVRVAFAVVAIALSVIRYPEGLWSVAVLLIALAVTVPRYLVAWVLILLLAAGQLARSPAFEWQFFVLLAGVHLLHVLAAYTLVVPLRSWVQVAVFRRPLIRFVVIQVPVQIVAALALAFLVPTDDGPAAVLPVAGIVGGVALVVLTLLLIVPGVQSAASASASRAPRSGGKRR